MKPLRPPRVETRRAKELEAELLERARAWIPSWGMDDDARDVGRALLKIAARFGSEVAERLDRAGEKVRLGFLDWLAVQGEAARPARLPVVFQLTDSARAAKPAAAGTRLQVEAAGASVVLETETELLVLPRGLQALVGVDGAADAFFLAPPGLTSLAPLEPLPAQWQLKSFASSGATRLQLDPEQGLAAGMLVELGGKQYRVVQVNQDIVTLEPPLAGDYAEESVVTKVTSLVPFDGAAQNRQEHALYIGHKELFDIEAAATIEITGARELAEMAWHYWGKRHPADETGWQALSLAEAPAQAASSGIVLAKPKGAMAMLELVKGSESRWIRASVATVEPSRAPLLVDGFAVRVNCEHAPAPAPGADPALAAPYAEGMANTTPLMLDNVFFPLGKDPHQFDAFYLGSQEAFSKKGAQVQLCFEMADPNFASLTSLRSGPQPDHFLAGVAADGQLHLFQFLPLTGSLTRLPNHVPLRPPAPAVPGAPAPQGSVSVALDPRPAYRVPVWLSGTDIFVAVAARGAVWLWHENGGTPNLSGWFPLDAVGPVADPASPIDGLVYLADGPFGRLCALRDGALFVRDLNTPAAPWEAVETREGTAAVTLAKIAPVCLENVDLGNGTLAQGLVGVSTDNKLFAITLSGVPLQGSCTRLLNDIAVTVAPAAVRRQDNRLVAAAVDTNVPTQLVAGRFAPVTFALDAQDAVALDPLPVAGAALDMNFNAAALMVALSLGDVAGSTALASWVPFATAGLNKLFKVGIPAALGAAAGAPTLMARHVLVPTSSSQVIVAGFDLARRLEIVVPLSTAIIAVDAPDRFAIGDRLAIPTEGTGGLTEYKLEAVNAAGVDYRGRALYEFNHQAIDKPLFFYRTTVPLPPAKVHPAALDTIEIDAADPEPATGDIWLITTDVSTDLYVVKAFNSGTHIATLDRPLDLGSPQPATVTYIAPQASQALIRPMLHLDPLTTGNWPAALLDSVSLFFPGAIPAFQPATAYKVVGDRPELVVLAQHWQVKPPLSLGNARFIVDGTVGEWVAQLGDTSTNPELSWEYWNGKGWWKLDVTNDATLFLKKSGAVHFGVPADIASSDWAGKTNYWVRARLIGGDYGRETVTVTTEDLGNGKSRQTVNRSTEGIRPPSVARLRIAYSVCDKVEPAVVLVRESGSVRDQSDANRTPGAMVEAFVPLALLLGRLSGPPAVAAAAGRCPPDCQCPGADAGTSAPAAGASARTVAATAPALGRAIYLGFDAPLLGEPVKLLLLVEERAHDAFAPMRVEALVGDRFVPVIVTDATRALGESGVLSLAFPIEPTPRELFGQTLSWLRLAPAAGGPSADWKPKLLGAYLNGVWASAAETLTRELIGSSQGEPNLTLYLARPPVLRHTLELRVKEPLGEEEREALNAGRADQVLSALENQPGDWVLWQQVIDPGDEAPAARVYALDEASGEIRFGDGRHGRIPPVGRDSIMALTYRRTAPGAPDGPSVPGNAIAARTALNLVSPIDGVEAVFAASQAAGGAPAEDAGLVLRFGAAGLRHRERALTAPDVEDLVLEDSPDIAQARCFPRKGFVQLVVVMRGADPMPGAAQLRELHRTLVAAASPLLGARRALRIRGPALRRLRVDLRLRVVSLDDAGAVAREARKRIVALFETATGGVEGDGWPLGESPGEADVALKLADVPRLQGIAAVDLHEIADDGSAQPWPQAIERIELPWLAKDGVRIAFESVGVAA